MNKITIIVAALLIAVSTHAQQTMRIDIIALNNGNTQSVERIVLNADQTALMIDVLNATQPRGNNPLKKARASIVEFFRNLTEWYRHESEQAEINAAIEQIRARRIGGVE